MDSTTLVWPASYKGIGLAIRTLAPGCFQGYTADGYTSPLFTDYHAALAHLKAHIDTLRGH